jgi:hypothetical protein
MMCSRDDLLAKTMQDIPSLGRTAAEMEVDRFFLDAEMLNMYIQFQKELERDPNFVVPVSDGSKRDEGLFSVQNLVGLYLIYVFSTSVPVVIRRTVQAKIAEGTWEGTHIPPLDNWITSLIESAPTP